MAPSQAVPCAKWLLDAARHHPFPPGFPMAAKCTRDTKTSRPIFPVRCPSSRPVGAPSRPRRRARISIRYRSGHTHARQPPARQHGKHTPPGYSAVPVLRGLPSDGGGSPWPPCQAFTPDTHGHAASTPGTHGTRLHARPRREVIPLQYQYHRPTREWRSYRAISCLRVCPAMIPGVGVGPPQLCSDKPAAATRGDTRAKWVR